MNEVIGLIDNLNETIKHKDKVIELAAQYLHRNGGCPQNTNDIEQRTTVKYLCKCPRSQYCWSTTAWKCWIKYLNKKVSDNDG